MDVSRLGWFSKNRPAAEAAPALRGPLALALFVVALEAAGLLRPLGDPLHDAVLRARTLLPAGRPSVLLVEVTGEAVDAQLVDGLAALEPAGLALTDWRGGDLEVIGQLQRPGLPIVLGVRPAAVEEGRPVGTLARDPRLESLAAWSLAGRPAGGVHRCQLEAAEIGGRLRPTLEWAVAARSRGDADAAPVDRSDRCFGIAFRGDVGSLPRVTADRVREQGLVRELVAGRWLLIGPGPRDQLTGVHTPTTGRGQRMSLLEFHGHALETLLSGQAIRGLPWWGVAALLIVAAVAMRWIDSRVRTRWLLVLSIGFGAAVFVVAVLALPLLQLRLPTGAMLLLVAGSHVLTLRDRVRFGGQSARRLADGLLGRLRSRLLPDGAYLAENPWPDVAAAAGSALGSRRLLLLECVPGSAELRQVHAEGCSLESVDEALRMIDAPPYRRAIRAGRAVWLEEPLLPVLTDDVQGLSALTFGSDLLGFWAWSVDRRRAAEPGLEVLASDLAGQIAEVFYHRLRTGGPASAVQRTGDRAAIGQAYAVLQWTAVMLERHLVRFESLLQGLGASVLVFDLFGRVVEVTDAMLERLNREGLSPHQLSSTALVARLARRSENEARELLRQVLLTRRPATLPAFLGPGSEPTTFMILAAIDASRGAVVYGAEQAASRALGISLELLETSSMQVLSEVKAQLTERLGDQLARDLGEIRAALGLLRGGELGGEVRGQALAIVDAKMDVLEELVDECRQYLAIDLHEMGRSRYPVDLARLLRRIVDERRELAERRSVGLEVAVPDHAGQVLASSIALDGGLRALFDFLLEDAEAGAPLWVRVEEADERTTVSLSNRGSGYVQDELDEILRGSSESGRPGDSVLPRFREQVELWGGTLSGTSHIGVGSRFELELERSKLL